MALFRLRLGCCSCCVVVAQVRLGAALLVEALRDVPAAVADLPAALDQAGKSIKQTHRWCTLECWVPCTWLPEALLEALSI